MRPKPTFALLALPPALCLLLSGCTMLAASGDIEDGSVERTAAKDHDARMRRMREGGTLRPGEYDALRDKMGEGRDVEVSHKPSVDELEKRVEERRRQRESGSAE